MDNDIKKYYKNIDENIDHKTIDKLLENNKLKNILKLSTKIDLCLFKKGKKEWKIKNNKQIIKDCKVKKKKKLESMSKMIKELAKDTSSKTLDKIKIINKELEDDIQNIDSILKVVNNDPIEDYIEVYSN